MAEATPQRHDVDVDEMFEALASERRRIVLRHLLWQRRVVFGRLLTELPSVTIDELVDSIARAEFDGRAPPDDFRDRVATGLRHVDLPKLASSKLVDYDAERGSIAIGEAARDVEPYLERAWLHEHAGFAGGPLRQ